MKKQIILGILIPFFYDNPAILTKTVDIFIRFVYY